MQKSDDVIQNYLDSLYVISHSGSTVHIYRSAINHFKKFVQSRYSKSLDKVISELKNNKLDQYEILKEFVIYLDKAGKKPASIKIWVGGAKGFLRHCGVKIYSEDFQMKVRLPKIHHQREEPLTKEILVRLLSNVPVKIRTMILCATASGMRIGEIVQFKLSDIDFESNPTKIRIRAEITKTREARETFLTNEATKALKDYLTKCYGWDAEKSNNKLGNIVIFGSQESSQILNNMRKKTPLQYTVSMIINSMKKYTKNIPELAKRSESGRYMIHFHAFRKYFRTVVGNAVGRDYAEALMGHHFYLDTYYNLPEEKKREMYLQAEPFLTISDYAQIEKDLRSVKQRQKQIEEKQLDLIQIIKDEHVRLPASLQKYVK